MAFEIKNPTLKNIIDFLKNQLGSMSLVDDAPRDSKKYSRKNGFWVEINDSGGGGGDSTNIGDEVYTEGDQLIINSASTQIQSFFGNIAPEFDNTISNSTNDIVMYDNKLFTLTEGHTAPATWENTTHVTTSINDILKNKVNISGITTALGYTPVNKAGDTMTGTLFAKASQYTDDGTTAGLNMNNSNIVGVNAIYTADLADNAGEGINFYRDATHADTLWVAGGQINFVPNRAYGTNTTAENSQKVARFTANPTTSQLVITDGTTGGIQSTTIIPSSAEFANETWYKVGNDAYMGDANQGGCLCIKTQNTSYNTGVAFVNSNGTAIGSIKWDGTNFYTDKTFVFNRVADAASAADQGPALIIGGTRTTSHIEIDDNEIVAKTSATTGTTLYLNDGNPVSMAGSLTSGKHSATYLSSNGGISAHSHLSIIHDDAYSASTSLPSTSYKDIQFLDHGSANIIGYIENREETNGEINITLAARKKINNSNNNSSISLRVVNDSTKYIALNATYLTALPVITQNNVSISTDGEAYFQGKNYGLTIGTAPSSESWVAEYNGHIKDKKIGYVGLSYRDNKKIAIKLVARNYLTSNGKSFDNSLCLTSGADETYGVEIPTNAQSAWRTAIGMNVGYLDATTNTTNTSKGTLRCRKQGNIVNIYAATPFNLKSDLASGSSIEICTIPDGYRPPANGYVYGGNNGVVKHVMIWINATDGKVSLCNNSGYAWTASTNLYINGTYILA